MWYVNSFLSCNKMKHVYNSIVTHFLIVIALQILVDFYDCCDDVHKYNIIFITDLIQMMLQFDSLLWIMLRRRARSVWRSSLKSKAILQGHQEVLLFHSQQKIVQQVCIIITYTHLCLHFYLCVGQEALTLVHRII